MKKHSLILTFLLCLVGCSALIEKQASSFGDRLTRTFMNFEDPATVGSAMPTFIILMDSFARDESATGQSKLMAAQIIGAYSGAFVLSPERQATLGTLAYEYAKTGSCKKHKKWCGVTALSSQEFTAFLETLDAKDVSVLYSLAVAWLGYINAHSNDWNAVADLEKCKAMLSLVLRFDESWDNAGAHLYMGAIESTIPAGLGGKPEVARKHFERAITLTKGKHLLIKVEYARRLARTTFDKELHHSLLTEVVNADPVVPDLTLMNTWAQQQATQLLATEDAWFD